MSSNMAIIKLGKHDELIMKRIHFQSHSELLGLHQQQFPARKIAFAILFKLQLRLEVFVAVAMKITVFWDLPLYCSAERYQHFRGNCCSTFWPEEYLSTKLYHITSRSQ
jgi:hypothetical protein